MMGHATRRDKCRYIETHGVDIDIASRGLPQFAALPSDGVSVWRELDTAVVSVGIFGRTGVNRLEFAETGGDHAIRLDAFVLSCGPATRQDPSSDRRPNLPHHHARGSRAEPPLHSDIP